MKLKKISQKSLTNGQKNINSDFKITFLYVYKNGKFSKSLELQTCVEHFLIRAKQGRRNWKP